MLTRSVLYLTTHPGELSAVVDVYRDLRILEDAQKQDGCLGSELLRSDTEPETVLVTALWRDAESYAGWLANPLRERARSALEPLLVSTAEAALYDVALRITAGDRLGSSSSVDGDTTEGTAQQPEAERPS